MAERSSSLREVVVSNGYREQGEEDDVNRFHCTSKQSEDVLAESKNGEVVSRDSNAMPAVERPRRAGQPVGEGPVPEGFGIGPDQLENLMQEPQIEDLEDYEGVHGITKLLRSNAQAGIDDDDDEVEKRKEAFGSNNIPAKPGKGFLVFVWEACHETTFMILMVCAVVSFGAGMWSEGPEEGWYDGVSIGAAVMIVIAVTAVSDYRQSFQFRSLSDEKKNVPIEVVRGGRRVRKSVFDIVVGDIVNVNIGDQIPADGIFVSGQSLAVDESSMTGESRPAFKDAKHPFMLSGCKISDGYGTMLVTAVGVHTEWGRVMATLTEDNGEETPLQVRLIGAATFIRQIGLTVAILVFVILFIRFFAVEFKDNKTASNAIKKIVNIFEIAVTIIVVAVPEGLPLAVTLTLAYSMRKMMRDKALVRNIAACETLGSATTICSDKTGTLTLNEVVEGSVYANIEKFIQFQLTINVAALVINFVAAVSSSDMPLTPVQLLWVNLIMDTLGALALATEEPTDELMQRGPVRRREPLIMNIMGRNIIGQAFYQIVVLIIIDYGGMKILKLEDEHDPERTKRTIVFNAFVFCQIFNLVNSRKVEKLNIFQDLHRHYLFMSIVFIETVVQFLIVQYLKNFASTAALTWQQWLICIAIGSVAWPIGFIVKFVPVDKRGWQRFSGRIQRILRSLAAIPRKVYATFLLSPLLCFYGATMLGVGEGLFVSQVQKYKSLVVTIVAVLVLFGILFVVTYVGGICCPQEQNNPSESGQEMEEGHVSNQPNRRRASYFARFRHDGSDGNGGIEGGDGGYGGTASGSGVSLYPSVNATIEECANGLSHHQRSD